MVRLMTDESRTGDENGTGWLARLKDILRGEPSTREELLEFLRDERWERVLDADELEMLRDVLEVSETQVRDVMVPRSQMVVIEAGAPRDEILQTIIECGHSRFPVLGEERDEVVGILLAKDLLRYFMNSGAQEFDLARFLRPAVFIPESKRLNTLLKQFRVSRNHMAIVVDEYGGIAGLLTIEDVLEEIVGEIDDEHDPREAEPIQQLDDQRYSVQALTRIDDFNDYFDVELSDDDYDTVGGLVIHQLGRMPRRGDVVATESFRFKVLQADRRRVYGVEVTRLEAGD
jgi:magnesium and cobalt transporter